MQVSINGIEKEVIFKNVYTRKMDREYNEFLFEGAKLTAGSDFILEPNKMQKANDYLITVMTNLTAEEVDELSVKDYNSIMEEIGKIKNPEGSKVNTGKVQKDN